MKISAGDKDLSTLFHLKLFHVAPEIILILLLSQSAFAFSTIPYYSPHNAERPTRSATYFIILHTTEAPTKSSLRKLCAFGEAHYLVDPEGRIYRIIDKNRVAYHAGTSMWDGLCNIDNYSIGIEVVGYHNQDITEKQYKTLRELLTWLKSIYRINDDNVLTHSMVAYGTPNKWYRKPYRGRKRCGMLFAIKSVRRKLGLYSEPSFDPDVRAGRLMNADPYLASVLYNNVVPSTLRTAGLPFSVSERSSKEKLTPPVWGSVKFCKTSTADARDLAGKFYNSSQTIYILPGLIIRRGDEMSPRQLASLPQGTCLLIGYTYAGMISGRTTPVSLCGQKWNHSSTRYLFPDGYLWSGNQLNGKAIPAGTRVFLFSDVP
jgi:hypothetical protein